VGLFQSENRPIGQNITQHEMLVEIQKPWAQAKSGPCIHRTQWIKKFQCMNSFPELVHPAGEISVPKLSIHFVSKLHITIIITQSNYPVCAQCGWIQPRLKKGCL
jgi:hypothetical protein